MIIITDIRIHKWKQRLEDKVEGKGVESENKSKYNPYNWNMEKSNYRGGGT